MKKLAIQCCWFIFLIGLNSCKKDDATPSDPVAIIETAIPNGLIPGSALTLKGKNFLTVASVKLANTTVPASSFIRTATNELSFRVPQGTTAGKVCIVNEKGQGEWKDMALITSGNLTTDNVGVNVSGITQGYYSDTCSPRWFVYCYNGVCLIYRRQATIDPNCDKYYSIQQIGGSRYEVYPHPTMTIKFELKDNTQDYTGLVILEANGITYLGSMVKKTLGGNIVAYSVTDGQELKLCNPYPTKIFTDSTSPYTLCTQNAPCTTCR